MCEQFKNCDKSLGAIFADDRLARTSEDKV